MTASPLRAVLDGALAQDGYKSLKDLTVLAPANDPYRVDTPTQRAAGEWFAGHAQRLLDGGQTLHLRGFHYALLGETKPDGSVYVNTDREWTWLQERAADGARWLGLVPFDSIVDERNSKPVLRVVEQVEAIPFISIGDVDVVLPDDLEPRARIGSYHDGQFALQSSRLAIFGEKISLKNVVGPIAERYGADLYLPTGNASDTMCHTMARVGAEDGRRLIVFYLSDCDPSGWNMAIEVGRKLQAFRDLLYPDLEFELHPVALTPDQVREYGLPSTPMKESEKRADAWRDAMGVDQTEIDSIATLRPELLRDVVTGALDAYYDSTLEGRVFTARMEWERGAQEMLVEQLGPYEMERIRADAEEKLGELHEQVEAINDALRIDTTGITLPDFKVPEPRAVNGLPSPLIDSDMDYAGATQRLIAHKRYEVAS